MKTENIIISLGFVVVFWIFSDMFREPVVEQTSQQEVVAEEKVVVDNTSVKAVKQETENIVATMMATAMCGNGSISVAYVMYDNGKVEILNDSRKFNLPFTKEQARMLMQAKLDGKACNY